MLSRFVVLLLSLSILVMTGLPASSAVDSKVFDFSGKPDMDGVPAQWKLKVKSGSAEIKVVPEDNEKVIYMKSSNSSFSLEREANVDVAAYPNLEWKWRLEKLPPNGDMRNKDANDQALQLLIAFEGRKILSYVWDSNAPEGTVTDESIGWPINLQIKVIAVKSGAADKCKWITMDRNVYQDFKKYFGGEPSKVKGVRVQSNTQYTWAISEGYFGKIVFLPALSTAKNTE